MSMRRTIMLLSVLVLAAVSNPVPGLCYGDAQIIDKKVFVQRPTPTTIRIVVVGTLKNVGDENVRCIVVGGLCANYLDKKRWEDLGGNSRVPVSASTSEQTFRIKGLPPGGKTTFKVSCEIYAPRYLIIREAYPVELEVKTMVLDDCPWLE